MVVLDADRPTATFSSPAAVALLTTQGTLPVRLQGKGRGVSGLRLQGACQTGLEVDPTERGDEKEHNEATPVKAKPSHKKIQLQAAEDGAGNRVRSELARDLVQRVDELLPWLGDVSLATRIGLLKRDLSRCHELLTVHPGESDYLSIITLVESAMAQRTWKQYEKAQLEAIRYALEIGYRQVRVRFEDYEKARALFSQKGVDPTPRIDLESLSWEDIADAEEE